MGQFDKLINNYAKKVKKGEVTIRQIEAALKTTVYSDKAASVSDVRDKYAECINAGIITLEEVEEHLCGKKR